VERRGFTHRYNSVKRFVRTLRARDPDRFDVLESDPAEESQVDFGQGAPTLWRNGKYRRPWLFVMTLKYSGKAFRKVVWKADQRSWARLHEEAFRSFGGSVEYVVLDNLKQGVIKPDPYEPQLNPVFAALLKHYDCTADVCRIEDPDCQ
jgi:transposase